MDKAGLELVKDWLTRAHQDLRAARILAGVEDAPLDVAIYHCQQAGEKAVKAFLQWRDEPFAKTHNLRALVIQAISLDKGFEAFEKPAEILTPYVSRVSLSRRRGRTYANARGIRRSPATRPGHLRFRSKSAPDGSATVKASTCLSRRNTVKAGSTTPPHHD